MSSFNNKALKQTKSEQMVKRENGKENNFRNREEGYLERFPTLDSSVCAPPGNLASPALHSATSKPRTLSTA